MMAGIVTPPAGKGGVYSVPAGTPNYDPEVEILDPLTGQTKYRLPFKYEVRKVAFSDDGAMLAVQSGIFQSGYSGPRSFNIHIYDVITGALVAKPMEEYSKRAEFLAFGKDATLAWRQEDSGATEAEHWENRYGTTVVFWNALQKRAIDWLNVLSSFTIPSTDVNRRLVVAIDSSDQGGHIISVRSPGKELCRISHPFSIAFSNDRRALALSPDGSLLAGIDLKGNTRLVLWRTSDLEVITERILPVMHWEEVAWSPDGSRILITAALSNCVICFECRDKRL
jgi:WD40 repeat protein